MIYLVMMTNISICCYQPLSPSRPPLWPPPRTPLAHSTAGKMFGSTRAHLACESREKHTMRDKKADTD